MMYKRISMIFLSFLFIFVFTGCSDNSNNYIDSSRFYKADEIYEIDGSKYAVNVDKKTDNVYLVSVNSKATFPLYGGNGKITKYSVDSKNFTKQDSSNVDSSRFYKISERYEIDGTNFNLFVDRKTDNIYLVAVNSRDIIPLFGDDGDIAKYSNSDKIEVQK